MVTVLFKIILYCCRLPLYELVPLRLISLEIRMKIGMLACIPEARKPIHVELSDKGRHVVVLEVDRQGELGELTGVVDLKSTSIWVPRNKFGNLLILD